MADPQFPSTPYFVPMTEEMLPVILDIESRAYPIGWSSQLFKDCLQKQYLCQVMMIDDEVAGYYVVQTIVDEFHILNICVSPELQGLGLGRYQLQSILKQARTDLMNRILLEVRASNRAARKLYTSTGFHIIGKRKNYYPLAEATEGGREDAQVMELALD